MRIDSHQHFWQYNAATDDSWMKNGYELLRRNMLPQELINNLKQNNFAGSILVQHVGDESINDFYLNLAREHSEIMGIVAWVGLKLDNIDERLAFYAQKPIIKGFRHMVEFEPQPHYILDDKFCNGISKLSNYNFTYDILVTNEQLDDAVNLVTMFPKQKFVLDHLAKPDIKNWQTTGSEFKKWQKNIELIAQRSNNTFCKLSGFTVLDDWKNVSLNKIQPYFDVVVKAFGFDRVMFGSDWPVSLAVGDYALAIAILSKYITSISPQNIDKVFGANAIKFYNL
jgi:L-fuconolactonase